MAQAAVVLGGTVRAADETDVRRSPWHLMTMCFLGGALGGGLVLALVPLLRPTAGWSMEWQLWLPIAALCGLASSPAAVLLREQRASIIPMLMGAPALAVFLFLVLADLFGTALAMPVTPVAATWIISLAVFTRHECRTRQIDGVLCGNCGYNMTGNVTGTCPECGGTELERRSAWRRRRRRELVAASLVALLASGSASFANLLVAGMALMPFDLVVVTCTPVPYPPPRDPVEQDDPVGRIRTAVDGSQRIEAKVHRNPFELPEGQPAEPGAE